jgi:hypothetical protein
MEGNSGGQDMIEQLFHAKSEMAKYVVYGNVRRFAK